MVFFTLHFFPILSYPLLVHCDFRRCKNAHMHKRVPSNIPYGNTQLQQQPTNNEPTKHTISSTWHSTNLHRVFGLNFSIFTMLIHKCEIRKKKKNILRKNQMQPALTVTRCERLANVKFVGKNIKCLIA